MDPPAPTGPQAPLTPARLWGQTTPNPDPTGAGNSLFTAPLQPLLQDNHKAKKIWLPSSLKPGLGIKAQKLTRGSI